jgi:hypothetical protein
MSILFSKKGRKLIRGLFIVVAVLVTFSMIAWSVTGVF